MTAEIIVEFPSPLTEKEQRMIYGYKGELIRCRDCELNKSIGDWVECPISEMYGRKASDNYCSVAVRKEE